LGSLGTIAGVFNYQVIFANIMNTNIIIKSLLYPPYLYFNLLLSVILEKIDSFNKWYYLFILLNIEIDTDGTIKITSRLVWQADYHD